MPQLSLKNRAKIYILSIILQTMKKGLLVILCIIILLFLVGCASKEKKFQVVSGDMEPTLKQGDIITTQAVTIDKIKPGDIVVFESKISNATLTRVVDIDQQNQIFTGKTDNNKISGDYETNIPLTSIQGLVIQS